MLVTPITSNKRVFQHSAGDSNASAVAWSKFSGICLYRWIDFVDNPPRMIRALMVMVDPGSTWERVEQEHHGIARVFAISTLPLLLVVSAIEAYGFMTWGRERGMTGRTKALGTDLLMRYEATQFIIALVLLFFGAWLLKLIAEGFHRRHTYQQSFVTTAYAFGPFFLSRALNAIPNVNLWITWAIGIALVLAALYRGLPRIMKPDPSNALGLYMLASIVFVLVSGLGNFVAIMVLDEKIPA